MCTGSSGLAVRLGLVQRARDDRGRQPADGRERQPGAGDGAVTGHLNQPGADGRGEPDDPVRQPRESTRAAAFDSN